MAKFLLIYMLVKAAGVGYQLIFTDKSSSARIASVLIIGFEGWCAYWMYFMSGLFA